ncbi:MAG: RNB domain-containing ribonuclease, partial [Planctomycetota bacterium]
MSKPPPENPPPPGSIVQYRKGPDVLLARITGVKGNKLLGSDENGKQVYLQPDRVLQAAGQASTKDDAAAAAQLAKLREAAHVAAEAVDIELLWQTVGEEEPRGWAIDELTREYLGRSGTPAEHFGLGLNLCADKIYFKQRGLTFHPRAEAEVEKRIEQRKAEARAERLRGELIAWVIQGQRNGVTPGPPPEGTDELVDHLIQLAVRGDEAAHLRPAKILLQEIADAVPKGDSKIGVHADGAHKLLQRLEVFAPHENLFVRRYHVPTTFPAEVLEAAQALVPYRFNAESEPWRKDLRHLPTYTIDNADTLDRDDAFSLGDREDGAAGRRLWIHIADPTPVMPTEGPLEDDALGRGTSVYLPTVRYPMLPRCLSEGMLSLDVGDERATLTIAVDFSPTWAIDKTELLASVIAVDENLTYDEADAR